MMVLVIVIQAYEIPEFFDTCLSDKYGAVEYRWRSHRSELNGGEGHRQVPGSPACFGGRLAVTAPRLPVRIEGVGQWCGRLLEGREAELVRVSPVAVTELVHQIAVDDCVDLRCGIVNHSLVGIDPDVDQIEQRFDRDTGVLPRRGDGTPRDPFDVSDALVVASEGIEVTDSDPGPPDSQRQPERDDAPQPSPGIAQRGTRSWTEETTPVGTSTNDLLDGRRVGRSVWGVSSSYMSSVMRSGVDAVVRPL